MTVTTHAGFDKSWAATRVRVDAIVMAGERSLAIARECAHARRPRHRRRDRRCGSRSRAVRERACTGRGPCTLVLRADAIVDDGLGVWRAFVTQADASIERQGLTRYREHQAIAPGADQVASPLTIASDGALRLWAALVARRRGGRGRPPVLAVERGIASGLALSVREAALRGREPNGGVRNLVVDPGAWMARPWASASSRCGGCAASRSIRIPARRRSRSRWAPTAASRSPVARCALDLIEALAHAQRSTTVLTRGAYDGPDAIWIDRAELIT